MIKFLENTLNDLSLLQYQIRERPEIKVNKAQAFDLLQGIQSTAKEIERLVGLKGVE